jgi:hypothetical protein
VCLKYKKEGKPTLRYNNQAKKYPPTGRKKSETENFMANLNKNQVDRCALQQFTQLRSALQAPTSVLRFAPESLSHGYSRQLTG